MNNGEIAVIRLNEMIHSLERAIKSLKDELEKRSVYDSYKETYIDNIRRLKADINLLEDQCRTFVYGG